MMKYLTLLAFVLIPSGAWGQLALSDFQVPAGQAVVVSALIDAQVSGVNIAGADSATILAGDLVVAPDLRIIRIERRLTDGQGEIRLRKTGTGNFRDYFPSNGDHQVHVQTTPTDAAAYDAGSQGGGFSNWRLATGSTTAGLAGGELTLSPGAASPVRTA